MRGYGCFGGSCNRDKDTGSLENLDVGITELGGLQNDEPTASIMPVDEKFSEPEPETVDQGEPDSRDSSSAAGCACKKNFLQSFVLLVGSLLIFRLRE